MLVITAERKKNIAISFLPITIFFSLDDSGRCLQFLNNEFYSFLYVGICNISIPTILAVSEMQVRFVYPDIQFSYVETRTWFHEITSFITGLVFFANLKEVIICYLVKASIAICIPNLNAYSKMAASARLMYSLQQSWNFSKVSFCSSVKLFSKSSWCLAI